MLNGQRCETREATHESDLAGLADYLKWPVFEGFSRTVKRPVG